MRRLTRLVAATAAAVSLAAATGAGALWLGGLPLDRTVDQALRYAVAHAGAVLYGDDLDGTRRLAAAYRIGDAPEPAHPFVFERHDAPHLVAFRERYRLDALVSGAPTEYDAMLKLAHWVGTRFPHATDPVPGGNHVCAPIDVVEAGTRGAGFWCEIAARTMVQAATAVGWPARVITASRDAYTWEHAVAELWSNEFDKWFVVDPDFNVVFEADGVPLSAWELVHRGSELRRAGRLVVRRFAPVKEGITPHDLIQYFGYAHVDLRTDWCTRRLRRGSPAGGDLATLWTARPEHVPRLTAIPGARTREEMDAPINRTTIAYRAGEPAVTLSSWSPVFEAFEVRVDDGPWVRVEGTRHRLGDGPPPERIEARVITVRGDRGPSALWRPSPA